MLRGYMDPNPMCLDVTNTDSQHPNKHACFSATLCMKNKQANTESARFVAGRAECLW